VAEEEPPSPFFRVETDKKVYYPGETMEVSVNLRLLETLCRVEKLVFQLKGKESFKFTPTSKK